MWRGGEFWPNELRNRNRNLKTGIDRTARANKDQEAFGKRTKSIDAFHRQGMQRIYYVCIIVDGEIGPIFGADGFV